MKLQRREWITIAAGAAIALSAILWRAAGSDSGETGSLAEAFDRLNEYRRLELSVEQMSAQLKVDIPRVTTPDQEVLIRRELAQLAGRHQLQISSTRLGAVRGQRPGDPIRALRFRLEGTGPFPSLVNFIHALEQSKIPFAVRDLEIKPPGAAAQEGAQPGRPAPGGRGGRGGQGDGTVSVSMQVEAWVFPQVFVSADAVAALGDGGGRGGAPGRPSRPGAPPPEAPPAAAPAPAAGATPASSKAPAAAEEPLSRLERLRRMLPETRPSPEEMMRIGQELQAEFEALEKEDPEGAKQLQQEMMTKWGVEH